MPLFELMLYSINVLHRHRVFWGLAGADPNKENYSGHKPTDYVKDPELKKMLNEYSVKVFIWNITFFRRHLLNGFFF